MNVAEAGGIAFPSVGRDGIPRPLGHCGQEASLPNSCLAVRSGAGLSFAQVIESTTPVAGRR
jgi:hypothetical protein